MKKLVLIISLLFTFFAFGQKNEFNLIALDSTWGQEVLRFPARSMDYTGVGEVRFPPKGWIQPEHKNFWSYTYAWSINVNRKITEKELALDLVKYFNSLNKIEMDDRKNNRYSSATITKAERKNSITSFTGKVKIFDRFATNKQITLNVKIESHYCKKKKRTVILFKFSPKEFKHKTWEMLEKVKLHTNLCD
jgi:hypothetical protein